MIKALLLAGGLGTRLRPLTDRVPKCLVPIAGRPLLDYWFDSFRAAGITHIRINTHHLRQQVIDYIARKNATGQFTVSESHEPALLGSGGTIHANAEWVEPGQTGLIVYADNLSDMDLKAMIAFHQANGNDLTMALFHTPYPEKCGIARMDEAGRIVEFIEKPQHPKGNLANAGVYVVSHQTWRTMAHMNQFDIAFDLLPRFVGRMHGWVWNGYHRDIGNAESLAQAEIDAPRIFSTAGGSR